MATAVIVLASAGLLALTAQAAGREQKTAGAETSAADRLRTLYPNTQFTRIEASPVPGLTQVVMGKTLAYVDPTGRYFVVGRLIDMETLQDLTAPVLLALEKPGPAALPADDAIVIRRGSGARTVSVFSDPDCLYCRTLDATLDGLDDVTIHVYLLPLETLHPGASTKARAIWCAPDRAAAWRSVMRGGAAPAAAKDCTDPIARIRARAEQLQVRATPTMFAADGTRLDGTPGAERLAIFLNQHGRLSGNGTGNVHRD
ncbi:MAG: DsbC family protein [Rhodocyclaceae bacterium]|nr:DsbC family protein [Rhodocyclaceae bacterium]